MRELYIVYKMNSLPQAMTHVEDSIMWCSPYLHAQRYAPDSPDRPKWDDIMKEGLAKRGMDADTMKEIVRSLPFGYTGTEGKDWYLSLPFMGNSGRISSLMSLIIAYKNHNNKGWPRAPSREVIGLNARVPR